MPRSTSGSYYAAPYAPACISCRLRGKVIPLSVDYHGLAYYVLGRKPFCIKGLPAISPVAKQGRQVSAMGRVRTIPLIVMRPCGGKRHIPRAITNGMYMHGKYIGGAGRRVIGQTPQLRYHYSSTLIRIKIDFTPQPRVGRITGYIPVSSGAYTHQRHYRIILQRHIAILLLIFHTMLPRLIMSFLTAVIIA